MKQEIDAMKNASHPNLVRILDADPDYKWYVMKYYRNGTLREKRNYYSGHIDRIFDDFCPFLEGVASIHAQGLVHRDIKPENIFIDDDGRLVLSDFGLVYELAGSGERLSGTEENVGTHAWMAPWLMEGRADPTSASDVFSLGKVLWWMTAPGGILRLWYFDRESYNLELKYPGNHLMRLVNEIIGKCVVEDEEDCLADGAQLLDEVNKCRANICRRCGRGPYEDLSEYANQLLGDGLIWEICKNCSDIRISGRKLTTEVIGFMTKNNPNNEQGAEWKYVETEGQTVRSIAFSIKSASSRWRAGFMIGEPNPESRQPLPVHEKSLLFHVGLTDGKYGTGAWEGNVMSINKEMPLSKDGRISLSFTHDGSNSLNCEVNGKPYPPFHVEPYWLTQVAILAWADQVDYAVEIEDIEIVPAFGLLELNRLHPGDG